MNTKTNEREELIHVLTGAGAKFQGNSCHCIFHDDQHASAGIYQGKDARWRFKCHTCGVGGDVYDMRSRLAGKPLKEILPEDSKQHRRKSVFPSLDAIKATIPGIVTTYEYPDGMIVFRCDTPQGKTFRQAHFCNGGYRFGAPAKPWPLFYRDRIKNAPFVIICEGEKCCEVLAGLGIIAVTNPAGAGKAEYADWSPLAGKKIVLWPDHDQAGLQHMHQVLEILQQLQPKPEIRWIEPTELGLEHKQDAFDFFEQNGKGPEAVKMIWQACKSIGPASGVRDLIERTIEGTRKAIATPWRLMDSLTKALQPESTMLLCGGVGASKSFMLLQAASFWHTHAIRFALYELEESRDFHLLRVLAQQSGLADLTDPDWITEHADKSRRAFENHRKFLDSFGASVWAAPDKQLTLSDLAEWTKQRADDGCRIICLDPITAAAHTQNNSWTEDNIFMQQMKRTTREYQCSVVLVTHPVKTVSKPNINQLAGSAAYQRFSQTVLWLESHSIKQSSTMTKCGPSESKHNRTLHILKARLGKGQGVRIACRFQGDTLSLHEMGPIIQRTQSIPEQVEDLDSEIEVPT